MTNEILQQKATEYQIPVEELSAQWKTWQEESKIFEPDNVEGYCKNRLNGYLAGLKRSKAENFIGIPVSVSLTDYGALKAYKNALKMYGEDPVRAMSEGFVNKQGNPVFLKGSRKGEAIDLEKSTKKVINMIAKKEKDSEFKVATLSIGGEGIEKRYPLFSVIKFRANISSNTTNEEYVLNGARETHPTFEKELPFDEIKTILQSYFPKSLTQIKKLEAWHEVNKEDMERTAAVIGNVVDLIETKDGIDQETGLEQKKSNILVLSDGDDESKTVTCWVPKLPELDLNFDTRAVNVVVMGRTSRNDTKGEMYINAASIWVKPTMRIDKANIEKVTDEKISERQEKSKPEDDWK